MDIICDSQFLTYSDTHDWAMSIFAIQGYTVKNICSSLDHTKCILEPIPCLGPYQQFFSRHTTACYSQHSATYTVVGEIAAFMCTCAIWYMYACLVAEYDLAYLNCNVLEYLKIMTVKD